MQVHDSRLPGSVRPVATHREGSAVICCGICGCRLVARESLAAGGGYGPDAAWRHYPGRSAETDARGCRVACADQAHRITELQARD